MDFNLVPDPFIVKITYDLEFDENNSVKFVTDVDLTSKKIKNYLSNYPKWAELDFHKCENCNLTSSEFKYCPAAISITDIVEYFSMHTEYESAKCSVFLPEKTIYVEKELSEILSCLVGLRMATSLCPFLQELKLMARFHDPFSTPYYTVYRASSMYLLKQYFKMLDNNTPDWSLSDLKKLYENLSIINMNLSERLKGIVKQGNSPCSMTVLSVFAVTMTLLFEEHLMILKELDQALSPES